jgi:peptidylprolyl isomerase
VSERGPVRASNTNARRAAKRAALAKAAAERTRARRRRQAILGAVIAVVVVALIVIPVVLLGGKKKPASTGSQSAASASAPAPGATAAAPAASPAPAVSLDPALSKKPAVDGSGAKPTELVVKILVKGEGAPVQAGQTLTVNYVGVSMTTGKEFDSSWSRNQPFSFQVGTGQVIQGWDQGLVGVPVGSRVQLDIPTDLAYGANPPSQDVSGPLRFVVDIRSAQ